ncbi:hypothetical protein [Streptomyces sp. NPDC047014]|uniref:hypothetical protein n=1 Tax=Streptomyces sp. NPDC047014 TaxID=3155736 RepID=UPI0033CE7763
MSWLNAHLPVLLLSLAFLCTFVGVVLPAVWSSQPERRYAASTVLAQLVGVLGVVAAAPAEPTGQGRLSSPAPPPPPSSEQGASEGGAS